MAPALRLHLLVLLTLPALLLPRGFALGWCLCEDVDVTSCCAPALVPSCCDRDRSEHPGPRAESPGDQDCPCCRSIEVEDFDEFLVGTAVPELPPHAAVAPFQVESGLLGRSLAGRRAQLRAPPGVVTPPGLLPGVAPLRI